MLPGFRFLFAAIVLSMSLLIFGLGAAALLRSAHEEVASLPSRRAPAEQAFTRQNDEPMPTLALLRVDPPMMDSKPPENAPSMPPETATPPEPAADAKSAEPENKPAEPEKLAALKPDEPMPAPIAKPETLTEMTTTATLVETATPVADEAVKVAAVPAVPQPSTTTSEPATDTPSFEGNAAAMKIATLGGPAVVIEEKTVATTTDAKPDRNVVKKRSAERARERRRIAARRARLAARQAAAAQQQANPFGQTTTARTAQ